MELRGEALSWSHQADALEVTLHRGPTNEIGTVLLRELEGLVRYVEDGPQSSYERHGYGLYRVDRRADGVSMGICGLVRRDELDHPDLGFAFLPAYRRTGYAHEAALAVLRHASEDLGLTRLLAVTVTDNAASIALLERLGFRYEGEVAMPGDVAPLLRYAWNLDGSRSDS